MRITGRLFRIGVALVAAAFSVSMITTEPVIGVIAGLFALMPLVSALTGRCPATGLGTRRQRRGRPNTFGYPEAHQDLTLLSGNGPT